MSLHGAVGETPGAAGSSRLGCLMLHELQKKRAELGRVHERLTAPGLRPGLGLGKARGALCWNPISLTQEARYPGGGNLTWRCLLAALGVSAWT
jgi:hypothetical protein